MLLLWWGGGPHLVVGHLQQVQHDFVSPHVLQQPLLLLPDPAAAHLIEPLQDLQEARGDAVMEGGEGRPPRSYLCL